MAKGITSEQLVTAARSWLKNHNQTVETITRDSEDYAEYKTIVSAIREINNFSKYSWKQVNDLISGTTASETSLEDLLKKYK
jgi:hypothetical protein